VSCLKRHRGELLLGRISLLEHERRYEEALALFNAFRQLQPVRDGLFGELDIMEEMLTSMIEETARDDAHSGAAQPLVEAGKSIREADDSPAPLVVGSAYPNPFRGNAVVPFTLPTSAHVEISAYDAIGKRVAVLIAGSMPAGRHRAVFNAAELPSGVYFIRAVVELDGTSAQTFVSKVVLAR